MDLNPMKKFKLSNSTEPRTPFRTVDELNSGNKSITKLNHDCLAKVFMHLPVLDRLEMENVCQKWNEAGEFPWYNVKKLDWNYLMITLDKREETLEMLMKKCARFLKQLAISGYQYPWMKNFLKNNCKNIIHFDIDMSELDKYKLTNSNLVKIISVMKKLKYLKVTIGQVGGQVSTCNLCNQILDKLPEGIQEIHLLAVKNVNNNEFHQFDIVLNKFNALHSLTLQGFELSNGTLKGILPSKNTLFKINLSECKFPSNALSIFKNLKNLEHLILLEIINFNVNEIVSIAHNCSKLKHVELRMIYSSGIPEAVPYPIFSELKNLELEHLRFGKVDTLNYDIENKIADIAGNWRELKYLDIERGHEFSLLDIQEITKFKKLQHLNICCAYNLHPYLFLDITSNCLELKELSMFYTKMPKSDIEILTNLKKIEKLKWTACRKLTENLVSKIAIDLVELNLFTCYEIRKDSLIHIGKLVNLKRLELSCCQNVPNAIFENLHKLEYLSCYKCLNINDKDIIKVIDNCLRLYYLDVRDTGITVESLDYASKRKFLFKILYMWVDEAVEKKYKENSSFSSYLRINNH